MRSRFLTILTLSFLFSVTALQAQKKVVGYYPSWNKTIYPHTAIQYRHLTHIVHAFIFPFADGSLDYLNFSLYPELISSARANNVKTAIAVGGWDAARTPRFSQMAADTAARRRFVTNMINFIQANGYDGIDLDWEYPKTAADRANLTLLVRELRTALNAAGTGLTLSMAGPATNWSGQWYDYETMKNDFDWIGVMTYDYYGAWTSKAGPNSALYGNFARNTEGWVDFSYTYYNSSRGVPKEKLLIGIPFYGQVFNASALYGVSTGATQSTYTNIVPRLSQGWARHWDAEGLVPFLINPQGTQLISYDDSLSVAAKCSYVNSKGSGGVIIWAIGQDLHQGRTILLETVGALLLGQTSVESDHGADVPGGFQLEQNYPNPFNSATMISYSAPERSRVRLVVFNALGQIVMAFPEAMREAGRYQVPFDASMLPSGVYLYKLEGYPEREPLRTQIATKKMLLTK